MDAVQKHLLIKGRVQGVGYRQFTSRKAAGLGISGWVRNREDGQVEAVIRGNGERVDEMIRYLKRGPAAAKVENIDVVENSDRVEAKGGYSSFEIRA